MLHNLKTTQTIIHSHQQTQKTKYRNTIKKIKNPAKRRKPR